MIVDNNIVEVNEQHYMTAIEKFLNKRLTPTKVPGPWKDEPKGGVDTPISPRLIELKEERIRQIIEKKQKKQQKGNEKTFERNKPKIDVSNVSLRNFKEGRFEDVMNKFDERIARKRGIIIPDNKKIKKWKKEMNKDKDNTHKPKRGN